METYIAFLRGINVGGQRKMKMAAVKESFEKLGFAKVVSYLQSGNVVFHCQRSDAEVLEARIEQQLEKDFGFSVPVIIRQSEAMKALLANNPFAAVADTKGLYFVLLKQPPEVTQIAVMEALQFKNEQFAVTPACVYLYCTGGYGTAKLNNNLVEQKLQVLATTRNLKTMEKMIALSQ